VCDYGGVRGARVGVHGARVGGVAGSRRRASSTDRVHRRTRQLPLSSTINTSSSSSSSSSSRPHPRRITSNTSQRSAASTLDTTSLQYAVCGAVRPLARCDRCPGDGGTLVVMKSRRDPDVVQNCALCRHAAAVAAEVPGQRRGNSQTDDDVDEDIGEIPAAGEDSNRSDRY